MSFSMQQEDQNTRRSEVSSGRQKRVSPLKINLQRTNNHQNQQSLVDDISVSSHSSNKRASPYVIYKSPLKISSNISHLANNSPHKPTIMMQLLKPPKPTPPLQDFQGIAAIQEFQDFLSQQIYRYVILNDHQYTGVQQPQAPFLKMNYKISREQSQSANLRKSVMILMNQHLQFLVKYISEMSQVIENKKTERPVHNYYSRAQTTCQTEPNEDDEIFKIQKHIEQKEADMMRQYSLQIKPDPETRRKQIQVQSNAHQEAYEFLQSLYKDCIVKTASNLPKQVKAPEELYMSNDSRQLVFQLDDWDTDGEKDCSI